MEDFKNVTKVDINTRKDVGCWYEKSCSFVFIFDITYSAYSIDISALRVR